MKYSGDFGNTAFGLCLLFHNFFTARRNSPPTMAPGQPRVSAASARAHTRKSSAKKKCCCGCCRADICRKLLLIPITILLAWFYKALQPPAPKVCGTPFGPPVTASRIQLHDGRHLAYEEAGVAKELAKYKVVMVHGFGRSRHDFLPVSQSLVEELGVYFVGFDRAGYGQSDPNPDRTVKSEAFDIQELADILGLGSKFYLITTSIGGYSAWSCLKYIPHRLAGVAMLCPVTNYWWSGIPFSEALRAFRLQPFQDQVAIGIVHYAPWLTYWWNTQRLFPRASVIDKNIGFLNNLDKEILSKAPRTTAQLQAEAEVTQQSVHESLHRDMINMFGSWEFDPGELENPYPAHEGSVHIWHGDEDYLVPVLLQRYVHRRLPWAHYHEIPGAGHFLAGVSGLPEEILRALLTEEDA